MKVVAAPLCFHCGGIAKRVTGRKIYPHRPDLYAKVIWECEPCGARVGSHPDGRPLGSPANESLRAARIAAHAAFDPLWKSKEMHRAAAYAWLKRETGVAHIGESTADQCRMIVEACSRR